MLRRHILAIILSPVQLRPTGMNRRSNHTAITKTATARMHGDVREDRIDQTAIARIQQMDRECRTDNHIPDQYAVFHALRSILSSFGCCLNQGICRNTQVFLSGWVSCN